MAVIFNSPTHERDGSLMIRHGFVEPFIKLCCTPVVRRVYRLGCVEVGPGYVRLVNKTNDTTISLTPEQEQRWRTRLMRQKP